MSTTHGEDEERPTPLAIRRFKDPIHDYIPIYPKTCAFIDTRQFQRLRSIKQLGTSYYVWPGAAHNRFEHCLGVAYLARRIAEHLRTSQPGLGITDRDVDCVEIAGLCHDLGHGPWSHVWDATFIPRALKNKKWAHEDASEMMFDDLVEKNDIEISEADKEFIKALIAGEKDRETCKDEKPFLFDIVANKTNGIDVDKFDYIMRDTHGIGEKGNISLTRLIHSARVIDGQICFDIKDANQVYELCYTRFSLHKRIYNHKTAKAIEYMIVDALLAAEPHMKIADQVDKPDQYVFLTDDVMATIEKSTEPELAEARRIFDRIRRRQLYKCIDYKSFEWAYCQLCKEYITPEKIVMAVKNFKPKEEDEMDEDEMALIKSLEPSHVIVDMAPLHYGMKDKNPLEAVRFYSKHSPNECRKAEPGDISLLMPSCFGEILLRVYSKETRFNALVQDGYRNVLHTMPDLSTLSTSYLTPQGTPSEIPQHPHPSMIAHPMTPPPKERRSSPARSPRLADNQFTTINKDRDKAKSSFVRTRAKRGRDEGQASDDDRRKKRA